MPCRPVPARALRTRARAITKARACTARKSPTATPCWSHLRARCAREGKHRGAHAAHHAGPCGRGLAGRNCAHTHIAH
eukprot:15446269-Alexandrium_andersonii.AAC.1